jgi:3-hydroxyacyl-CoA dehydrogenase
MADITRIAIIGSGLIGASWAALACAHGLDVAAFDPDPAAETRLRAHLVKAGAQLAELGLTGKGELTFFTDLATALAGAQFVQENGPEKPEVKRALLHRIDATLPPDVIIGSSTTALVHSVIAADCAHPGRVIVAHPFNPPHLVPLVELFGPDPAIIARAIAFYRRLGRHPVVLNREIEGHIANRLASALYREAVHLLEQGVASVADIDAALCNGPGLRWSVMGPHMTYHLGGGVGGIEGYLAHLGPSQARRWQALGNPVLDEQAQRRIIDGVTAEAGGFSIGELESRRDAGLIAVLKARKLVIP